MEEGISNVFSSSVAVNSRGTTELYDLLLKPQVKPVVRKDSQSFVEKVKNISNLSHKMYISRRISKKKVKTVRQIRKEYEEFVYENLPSELEKQHKYIFDKIRRGSAREELLVERGRKILNSYNPIKRLTWQILTNMNVEANRFPKQSVLWNNRLIVVNGSKGGSKKIICNLDKCAQNSDVIPNRNQINAKHGLLKSSLNVKFKAGPLTKKDALDFSFQKYTLGSSAPMSLPEVGLEISSIPGAPIDPRLYGYIQNSRDVNGVMTEEWINFAVSSLANNTNNDKVTFKLNYKNNQKRILMRHNSSTCETNTINSYERMLQKQNVDCNEEEVKLILNDIIAAVEIHFIQDNVISDDNELIQQESSIIEKEHNAKKGKIPKPSNELKKLDVTIIHMADNTETEKSVCRKPYCSMGCVCSSLKCKVQLKTHCSRPKCMFECKCDFKNYSINDALYSDSLAGIVHMDKALHSNLAKEEQKFHQTVLLTENKSIILSSKRRDSRMTKKYADYVYSLNAKTQQDKKELCVSLPYIDCANVETWCMVHALYRCFCKGKFIDSANKVKNEREANEFYSVPVPELTSDLRIKVKTTNDDPSVENFDSDEIIDVVSLGPETSTGLYLNNAPIIIESDDDCLEIPSWEQLNNSCSRTRPFCKRKYDEVNLKSVTAITTNEMKITTENRDSTNDETGKCKRNKENVPDLAGETNLRSKNFAIWLESRYLALKKKIDSGQSVMLEPPEPEKKTLYPWSTLLKRYVQKSNFFLVTLLPPKRVIIAINPNKPEFENYVDIRTLTAANLPEMPDFVKHLVSKTELPNTYVLMQGSCNCWEILGLVKKNVPQISPNQESSSELKNILRQDDKVLESNDGAAKIARRENHGTLRKNFVSTNDFQNEHLVLAKKNRRRQNRVRQKINLMKKTTFTNLVNSNKRQPSAHSISKLLKTIEQDTKQITGKETEHMAFSTLESSSTKNLSRTIEQDTKQMTGKVTEHTCSSTLEPSSTKQLLRTIEQDIMQITENEKITPSTQAPVERNAPTSRRKQDLSDVKTPCSEKIEENNINSKWFVMTVENDFTKLEFAKRNFFVTYKTIVSAIDLARSSMQTVILPLNKMKDFDYTAPQFGIYALPDNEKLCVLIGPYEYHEGLDMRTMKGVNTPPSNEKTRGVWLYTKKIDNESVLDDPFSYLRKPMFQSEPMKRKVMEIQGPVPQKVRKISSPVSSSSSVSEETRMAEISTPPNSESTIKHEISEFSTEIDSVETSVFKETLSVCISEVLSKLVNKNVEIGALPQHEHTKKQEVMNNNYDLSAEVDLIRVGTGNRVIERKTADAKKCGSTNFSARTVKVVKPITVKRNNGFFPLGNLVSLLKSSTSPTSPPLTPIITNVSSLAQLPPSKKPVTFKSILKSPITTAQETKQADSSLDNQSAKKGSFVILKPDEINNRIMPLMHNTSAVSMSTVCDTKISLMNDTEVAAESNGNSSQSSILTGTSDSESDDNAEEVYVISDEDDELPNVPTHKITRRIKEAMLTCENIPNMRGILCRVNTDKNVSFQFPGFKYTKYYTEKEASVKVNQVLSRKVFMPKSLNPKWKISPAASQLPMLAEQLNPEYVVTRLGLMHKRDLKSLADRSLLRSRLGLRTNKNGQIIGLEVEEEGRV